MRVIKLTVLMLICVLIVAPNYIQAGWNPFKKDKKEKNQKKEATKEKDKVAEAIGYFKEHDPTMVKFFDNAHGYAIFPTVGKGGMGIGGAYGKGKVFEEGKLVGTTSLKQITVGFQFGGQSYSEVIFFKTKEQLEDFKSGNFEFGAQASAVAVTSGVSRDAAYERGVAVFTLAKGGLMYEASVGGQKFTYKAILTQKEKDQEAEKEEE
jgi:lipid-binding SYLF domain-containing protein